MQGRATSRRVRDGARTNATLTTRAEVHVTLLPDDKVVAPHVFGTTGRFEVREPGTYTIRVLAEDERATGPICERESHVGSP